MRAIETALRLHQEADDILHRRGLDTILTAYGRVFYTGSYALDVMAWPDLDISMVLEPDPRSTDAFFEIGRRIAALDGVISMEFDNCLTYPIDRLPKGLYWGVSLDTEHWPIPWEIDIWAYDTYQFASNMALMDRLHAALTEHSRQLILEAKQAFLTPEGRTPALSGYHIYQAILLKGLHDVEKVRHYLRDQGVEGV